MCCTLVKLSIYIPTDIVFRLLISMWSQSVVINLNEGNDTPFCKTFKFSCGAESDPK